jgi:c-di-GMP-binding flagellar brake protein YcgR
MLDDLTFKINNKVEISWNDGYYKSNIENIDDGHIAISIPIKDGQYIPLRVGEQVEVIYYYTKNIYKFYTHVVNRKIDRIPIIILEYPKEIFKVQRRRFVRVPIVCSIEYSKFGNNSGNKTLKAIMVDLSGGGMRIKLSEEVNLGDKLNVYMPLGEGQLNVKGEVVRLEKEEDSKRNICGISFIDLDERTREKLIKFIFQIMRDQMRKG